MLYRINRLSLRCYLFHAQRRALANLDGQRTVWTKRHYAAESGLDRDAPPQFLIDMVGTRRARRQDRQGLLRLLSVLILARTPGSRSSRDWQDKAHIVHPGLWIEDPSLRRRVTAGLNKGEARNSLARAIFFNRLGEIRDRLLREPTLPRHGLNFVVAAIRGYGREGAINPHKKRYAASRNDGPSKSSSNRPWGLMCP
jgi:hypothetical protein